MYIYIYIYTYVHIYIYIYTCLWFLVTELHFFQSCEPEQHLQGVSDFHSLVIYESQSSRDCLIERQTRVTHSIPRKDCILPSTRQIVWNPSLPEKTWLERLLHAEMEDHSLRKIGHSHKDSINLRVKYLLLHCVSWCARHWQFQVTSWTPLRLGRCFVKGSDLYSASVEKCMKKKSNAPKDI